MNKQKHSSYVSLKLENTWNVRLERSAQLSFVVWNEPRSWLEERWTSFVRFVVCQDTQIRAKHDKAVWTCWGFFFSITYVHKVMFRTLFMGHTVFKVMWRSPMRNWLLSYHSTLPKVFYSSYKHRISAFSASWCNFVLNLDKVWVSTQGLVAEMFS